MTLDSCLVPPETSFRRQKTPCLSSKSAESHATKSAKDARRRRLELRRIRSSSHVPNDVDKLVGIQKEAAEDRPLSARRSSYGKISVVGRRREMDDAVAVELGFLKRGRESYDFFGVFEGRRVARACSQMLAEIVGEEIEWEEVMREGFYKVVAKGVAALVGDNEVVVAGTKAVLSRGGVAVQLLEGDEACVRVARRRRADEFLILGSDGFWDVISEELACQIARRYCSGVGGTEEAVALMAELAVAQGSKDNVSVVLVDLRGADDDNENEGIGIPTSSLANSV